MEQLTIPESREAQLLETRQFLLSTDTPTTEMPVFSGLTPKAILRGKKETKYA